MSCDDLDGIPENMPIIFEENYVDLYQLNNSNSHLSSSSSSSSFTSDQMINSNNINSNGSNNTNTTSMASATRTSILKRSIRNNYNSKNLIRRNSSDNPNSEDIIPRDELQSSVSENSNSNSTNSQSSLTASSKNLHRKLKKKTGASGDSLDHHTETNKAITLVSYRKTNDYFNDQVTIGKPSELSASAATAMTKSSVSTSSSIYANISTPDNSNNIQSKLSIIKADLAARSSLSSSSSTSSSISNTNQNTISNLNPSASSNYPNKGENSDFISSSQ